MGQPTASPRRPPWAGLTFGDAVQAQAKEARSNSVPSVRKEQFLGSLAEVQEDKRLSEPSFLE